MYLSQFGLGRRPFSSTPDPTCIVPVGGMPEAMSELEHCAQNGQGIGILTAPAGLGKTILCRKLSENLKEQFAVVFLSNANFPTRRSLLQAILYEMGHPYLRLGEQELRLEFTAAVRDLCPDRDGLVLIVDEAHLLHNRLLEELRTATHLVQNGEMLVRLILSGQLELEERLVKKDLAAINQRIVCHRTLSSLTMLESQEYLQQRVEWAGGRLAEVFEPEAARMICQASDGNPRCLNQLADHSLLLASALNDSLIGTAHVLDALEELRQLPLQWNHVSVPRSPAAGRSEAVEILGRPADDSEPAGEEPQTACFEWGPDDENTSPAEAISAGEESITEVEDDISDEADWTEAVWTPSQDAEEIEISWDAEESPAAEVSDEEEIAARKLEPDSSEDIWAGLENIDFEEQPVEDHYAQLDQGRPSNPMFRESRDWWTWDPVEELRAEEEAFDLPPAEPVSQEETIIQPLPQPGEEWQPEDLRPARRNLLTSDPSELIEQVLPLIDLALCESRPEIGADQKISAGLKNSSPITEADMESILANLSEIVGSGSTKDLDSLPFVVDDLRVWEASRGVGNSHDVFLKTPMEEPIGDLEEQIAQLVLDTHADVQPLLWSSTTESEPEARLEPPPRVAGEEPIRDPGDSTPFEELRESLRKAVEAGPPVRETPIKRDRPRPPIEYDIVLPELDDEPPAPRPVTRTDAGNAGESDDEPSRRSYHNLFSKIRHKKRT